MLGEEKKRRKRKRREEKVYTKCKSEKIPDADSASHSRS